MTYHKCTLAIPHRGGHKNTNEACRLVRARVLLFETEGWLKCWHAVEGARSQPNRSLKKLRSENAAPIQSKTLDKGFLNILQGLMDDGAFSKAANTCCPLASMTHPTPRSEKPWKRFTP